MLARSPVCNLDKKSIWLWPKLKAAILPRHLPWTGLLNLSFDSWRLVFKLILILCYLQLNNGLIWNKLLVVEMLDKL
jgi:hypothetical protein